MTEVSIMLISLAGISELCQRKVSRLQAHSSNFDMSLSLDYNIELYPLYVGDAFSLVLASSLSRGGMVEDEEAQNTWRPGKESKGIDEEYEYVMYGRVSFSSCLVISDFLPLYFG